MISNQTLRQRVNAIARTTLAPVPLTFWQSAFPKDVVALCYHVVSDADLPHLQLYPYKNAAQFEADVLFAKNRAVTYRKVADRRLHGAPLPKNSMLFTFDDGLVECFDVIRPVLKRHGVDAVFFVTTDYIDDRDSFFECTLSLCLSAIAALDAARATAILESIQTTGRIASDAARDDLARRRQEATRLQLGKHESQVALFTIAFGINYGDPILDRFCELLDVDVNAYTQRSQVFMSREQLRLLVKDGFTVGAHGRKHESHEAFSPQELEREIVTACEEIRAITGQSRVPFAFPYSGLGIDRTLLEAILQRNEIVEMIFDSGCLRKDPQFVVNRVFTDVPTRALAFAESNVPTTLKESWSVPSAWFRR